VLIFSEWKGAGQNLWRIVQVLFLVSIIFSAGLLEGKSVFIHGLDWCKDAPKQIVKNSLVKNVLCKRHNERLSILDDEAIKAFKIFPEEPQLTKVRTAMKPRYWTVREWCVNGPPLERWFLKTLINLACEGERKIGPDSQEIGQPSQNPVRIAYGWEKFQGQAGLYSPAALNYSLKACGWRDMAVRTNHL